ncbi:MAG: tetratricopeptide repeat protein, partial [Anaerolineales bacterium]
NYFKNGVIIMLTLISVFAALVTFLQNYASLRSSDLAEQSSFKAVNSTGLYFSAGLAAAQGTDALQRHEDDIQRAVRADTKARALRMGGKADVAAEYDLDAERWQQAADSAGASNALLADFSGDQALYHETLARDGYVEEEREHTLLDQSRAWSSKANGYVAVLSTLSVALFLAGLSLTLSSALRYLLAIAAAALSVACGVWVLVVLVSAVPRIPEDAIQQFVDGRIKYTIDNQNSVDATDAIVDFDGALKMAPAYGRAYFYRSLANTDSSLLDKHLDTQRAIDDGLQAIKLGNESSPVYGNLGWLYYINGQYKLALTNTETALAMSPNDCYLPFNHGLILLALGRAVDADAAYTEAIDCAQRQSSESNFNYYMDVGVKDLNELSQARTDLGDTLLPAIQRLKESLAQLRFYGTLTAQDTTAQFGDVTFGSSVNSDNVVLGVADEFPQSTTILYAQLTYSGLQPADRWMARWLLNGQEYLTTVYDTWDYGESGTAWVSVFNNAGLNAGAYDLDIFVNGHRVTSGRTVVLPGELPPMTSYNSTGVGASISYPETWAVTDIADNEVSVIAARDPANPTFFGVTVWLASTGTDADIFQLFELYLDAVKTDSPDLTSDPREPIDMAGGRGWSNPYRYTNKAGQAIRGSLAGVLTADKKYTFIVVIEANAEDWDRQQALFNVMLDRMTITRTE